MYYEINRIIQLINAYFTICEYFRKKSLSKPLYDSIKLSDGLLGHANNFLEETIDDRNNNCPAQPLCRV